MMAYAFCEIDEQKCEIIAGECGAACKKNSSYMVVLSSQLFARSQLAKTERNLASNIGKPDTHPSNLQLIIAYQNKLLNVPFMMHVAF